jgi:hypothetical protein
MPHRPIIDDNIDTEDFTATEVKRHRKQNQQYSRAPRVEPLDLIEGYHNLFRLSLTRATR